MKKALAVGWSSESWTDVTTIIVELTPADIEKINLCRKLCKEYDLQQIRIDADAELKNTQGKEAQFKPFCQAIMIHNDGSLFYYAQSKQDSSIQIESEEFTIE